jgi:glycosyltransferase involved in cell wall biosynthesis
MKRIVVFCDNVGWAIERVHLDVAAQLKNDYVFQFYDAACFVFDEVLSDIKNSDLCLVTLGLFDAIVDMFRFTPQELKKLVVVCHGFQEFTPIKAWSDHVTYGCVCDLLTPFFERPVHVVPNGVEVSLFFKKPCTGVIRTVGWCGRSATPCKRTHLSFEIARKSKLPISIAENVDQKDMQTWYHSIDVLLITSGPEPYLETGPLPPFEAIACGIPVIGTNVGNFLKVPGPKFSTTDEAAAILAELKADPERVRSLALEQYAWVSANWTYTTLAADWKSMFESALQKTRG